MTIQSLVKLIIKWKTHCHTQAHNEIKSWVQVQCKDSAGLCAALLTNQHNSEVEDDAPTYTSIFSMLSLNI
jgi:hypothetical protein